jgi:Zn-dependent protease
MPSRRSGSPMPGSFPLFRLWGIQVSLHWSWAIVAYFQIQSRADAYDSPAWKVAEYLALFAIVLMHEFGHALACRQVGGRADHIVLWPLGGVAYVNPPARPGAWLWSIAAGPLVNVVLVPITVGVYMLANLAGLPEVSRDADRFLFHLAAINLFLLIFNVLPVYPLDGGQILQALLWFMIGRARSLMVVSVIGLVVGLVVVVLAFIGQDVWFVVLAAFIAYQSYNGFRYARHLAKLEAARRTDVACPACGFHPPAIDMWSCERCRTRFDLFEHEGTCPTCHSTYTVTACPECHKSSPIADWYGEPARPPREWR